MKCPEHTTTKDIKCTFGPQTIKIVVNTMPEEKSENETNAILEGKLFQRIDVDGSTWTLGMSIILQTSTI